MKLFYTPGASSLASHIVLRETGLDFEMEKVDLREKKTENGIDYYTITSKGVVPALRLNNGQILTEGIAILVYIADQAPDKKLVPPIGSVERYHLLEWLSMIATELHKAYTPFFHTDMTDSIKGTFRNNLRRYYTIVEKQLSQTAFLMGDIFTVADAYLYTVNKYATFAGLNLGEWISMQAYQTRLEARPAIQKALKAEGV